MDNLVTELYNQIKNCEEGYVEWEKDYLKEFRHKRFWFFFFLITQSVLISLCVPLAIENVFGTLGTWIIIIITGVCILPTYLAYKAFNADFKKTPTKFDTVCTTIAGNIKRDYDGNASKFIDLLISDLAQKKTTTLTAYENTVKAVTLLPMLIATTAIGFILKGGFESKFSESGLNLILGIFFMFLLFKVVSYGIVSNIKNPILGKSYRETCVLRVLQVAKYEVLKSE